MFDQQSNTPHCLIEMLTPVLEKAGFWRFPHMNYFVRVRADVRDIIGWHQGSTSDKYAVYFGVWVPELEPDLEGEKVDESLHVRNISLMHDLSLTEPHRLTEWWDEARGLSEAAQSFVMRQVLRVAFPYFESIASVGDVMEMVYHDDRFHNTELEGRLLDSAFSSFFNYDLENASDQVVLALKPLQKLTPAFEYSGGYYWRHFRNGVFHIIVPEFFAAWRFVKIQVAVWHPMLDGMEQIPQTLPPAFSRVASRYFSADGKSASDMLPAFLGESAYPSTTLSDLLEGLRAHGLVWLEEIDSAESVRLAIRPEFKKFFPS
ncbi:MAG: hypothetical protein ACRCWR_00215 [Saezia sp.]